MERHASKTRVKSSQIQPNRSSVTTYGNMQAVSSPHGSLEGGMGEWIPDGKPNRSELLGALLLRGFVLVAVPVQNDLVGGHEFLGSPFHLVQTGALEHGWLSTADRRGLQEELGKRLGRPVPAQGQTEHVEFGVVAAKLDHGLGIRGSQGRVGGRPHLVHLRGNVQVLADPQPLGGIVRLLLSLREFIDGIPTAGFQTNLHIGSLGPEMDVRTVLPAILLPREVQGEHPNQDPVLVVFWGLVRSYLPDAGSRNFRQILDLEAGPRLR